MLHHLITLLLLFMFTVAVAQEEEKQEEDSKRPSWSAGLPERTKAADLNKPEFKPDNDIDIDMSDFGLQESTEIEMALPIGETMSIKAEKPTAEEIAEELASEDLANDDLGVEEDLYEEGVVENEANELESESVADTQPVIEEPVLEEPVAEEQVVLEPADTDSTETMAEAQPPVTEPAAEQIAEQPAQQTEVIEEPAAITAAAVEEMANDNPANQDMGEAVNTIDNSIASIDPPVMNGELDPVEAAEELASYEWRIIQQAPVKYPVRAAMDNQEGWVDVEVTIDPSGRVVSVSPVKYSPRGRIFGKPAVQSVNDWIFSPPSELGITENQTRVYKIEFEL